MVQFRRIMQTIFFDYNDYGMGEDKSGILFLITMSELSGVSPHMGEAIQIFTDAGQEYMTDKLCVIFIRW